MKAKDWLEAPTGRGSSLDHSRIASEINF